MAVKDPLDRGPFVTVDSSPHIKCLGNKFGHVRACCWGAGWQDEGAKRLLAD